MAFGTPEGALVDSELITMDALSIDDLTRAVVRELVLLAITVYDKELVVLYVCCGARLCIPVVGSLS